MLLPILCFGNPLLRQKCAPVEKIHDEIRQLARDMVETMDYQQRGIGLSAPQVGVLLRLFVLRNYIRLPDGAWGISPTPIIYINPKIVSVGKEVEEDVEGCLSIPGIRESVERPTQLTIEALDLQGQLFVEVFEGKDQIERFNARVRLHENDHLNGVLFIDRLPDKVRKDLEPKLREIKRGFSAH